MRGGKKADSPCYAGKAFDWYKELGCQDVETGKYLLEHTKLPCSAT